MSLCVCRRAWLLTVSAFVCVLAGGLRADGVGTTSISDDYLVNTWEGDANLSGSTVTSIVQAHDGYLWVGTYDGLIRFDGVHSVFYDSQNKPALSHSRIQGLYVDARGGIWINTYRG